MARTGTSSGFSANLMTPCTSSRGSSGDGKMSIIQGEERQGEAQTGIAIIGMACRLPGDVNSLDDFWKFCAQGSSGWSETPRDRYHNDGFWNPDPEVPGTLNYTGGHFLKEDLALFDAPFFNITAKQAEAMDPQQRLLLEVAYEALENGGVPLESISSDRVGVFMAASLSEYGAQLYHDTDTLPSYVLPGTDTSMLANRISYSFNFKGPSLTVDTACSSSLTALHLACQSIRSGEISTAVVGGCRLNLSPDYSVGMSGIRLFHPNGKSYAFDDRAKSGYGRGEGVSCIVIRALDDAIAAEDSIRAIIRGSGVNQDGKTDAITLPSVDAQEALIRSTYELAGLNPRDTQFIEAHGTGTATGDPVEANALGAVFGRAAGTREPVYLGSIKSNIGHLEVASGIPSVIKTAMMLDRGFMLPNCDFHRPNKAIPLSRWNLQVCNSLRYWPNRITRRASVTGFGFGGANAHFILEELVTYTATPDPDSLAGSEAKTSLNTSPRRVYVLTGKDESAVMGGMSKLAAYLERRREYLFPNLLSDLAYTVGCRRTMHPWRLAVSACSVPELVSKLGGSMQRPVRTRDSLSIGFVFTGQGAQWYGMGRELLAQYPVFRESIQRSTELLLTLGSTWSLIEELMKDAKRSRINEAFLTQPACTAIQMALVELMQSWNITPATVIGHSGGEIAAAYAAGAMTARDTLAVAYFCGQAMGRLLSTHPELRGGMMVVGLGEAKVRDVLEGLGDNGVSIACVNSPSTCTVSGDVAALVKLDALLQMEGVFHRRLQVNIAYHSSHVAHMTKYYRDCLEGVTVHATSGVRFFSSMAGTEEGPSYQGASYWVSNLVQPVRFSQAFNAMIQSRHADGRPLVDVLVEVGPHSALKGPILESLRQASSKSRVEYTSCLIRQEDAVESVLNMVSTLITYGCLPNMSSINHPICDSRKPVLLSDLPSYAWRHNERYWHESRIAYQHRMTRNRSQILGVIVPTSSDLEPVWRKILRLEHMPWLRDHKVQDRIVYPMFGYISLAIRARYQYALQQNMQPRSFTLREISILDAIVLTEDSEVEVTVSLRPMRQGTRQDSEIWREFVVHSWTKFNGWTEHCRGYISIEGSFVPPAPPPSDESRAAMQAYLRGEASRSGYCLSTAALYDMKYAMGINYGPAFQGLDNVRMGNGFASAQVRIPAAATQQVSALAFENDPLIHPTTLDICAQSTMASYMTLHPETERGLIPTFLESIVVRMPSNQVRREKLDVFAFTDTSSTIPGTVSSSFIVRETNNPTGPLIIRATNMRETEITGHKGGSQAETDRLSFREVWKPCVDNVRGSGLRALFDDAMLNVKPTSCKSTQILMAEVGLYYINRAIEALHDRDSEISAGRHAKLWEWMKKQQGRAMQGLAFVDGARLLDTDIEERLTHCLLRGPVFKLLVKVCDRLPKILLGEEEPISLMMEDSLLNRVYASDELPFTRFYPAAARFMELLVHQDPQLSVLEIGAGTGGLTLPLLQAIEEAGGLDAPGLRYDFTDIDPSFLETAREKFSKWGALLEYKTLNIEEDPVAQGFMAHSYDLVIASEVLHATRNIRRTLQNLHTLLKPGGKLLLIEEIAMGVCHLPFATLSSWWRYEDSNRTDGPLLSPNRWDSVLKGTGFSGVDCVLQSPPEEQIAKSGLFVSSVPPEPADYPANVSIVLSEPTDRICMERLTAGLAGLVGKQPRVETLATITKRNIREESVIFLDPLEGLLFPNLSPEQLNRIKAICLTQGVLWVMDGATEDCPNPNSSMGVGLLRTLRSENNDPKVVTVDLDATSKLDPHQAAECILHVFRQSFNTRVRGFEVETEYAERAGVIRIPRFMPYPSLDQAVLVESGRGELYHQEFPVEDRPLQLAIKTPGTLETLHFADIDIPGFEMPLSPGEIEIRVHAAAIGLRNTLIALGEIPGSLAEAECAGTVTSVGDDVTEFSIGDRVCAIARTGLATSARVPALSAGKIPESVSFNQAARIPTTYLTAYYSVVEVGRLAPGERVLIHVAAGGVGQAAIIIAQKIGAEIFATVGTEEKRLHLMQAYGIPPERIFCSRKTSFASGVIEATGGQGVDVVLNSLAGEALRATWKCLRPFGRHVEIGKRDMLSNSLMEMAPFEQNLSFHFVDLALINQDRPDIMRRLFDRVMPLIADNRIKMFYPLPVFAASDIEEAFRAVAGGDVVGKAVVDFITPTFVKATPMAAPQQLFRADASYLVTGGSGGIARLLARWMVRRGARHIILASRQGHASQRSQYDRQMLSAEGAEVALTTCDVTNEAQVAAMVEQMSQRMPPIAGIFNCTMVMAHHSFEDMTHESLETVVRPKVNGTWNIHNALLDTKLDFFISLSSIAGVIGNRTQAAYSAASTFLDGFTRYRRSLGLAADCINLGLLRSVGYVAENRSTREIMESYFTESIGPAQLLAMCTAAVVGKAFPESQHTVTTGLGDLRGLRRALNLDFKFRHCDLAITARADESQAVSIISLRERLASATTGDEVQSAVEEALGDKLCRILSLNRDDLDPAKPLTVYGIDSLSAEELRNWITLELEVRLSLSDIRRLSVSSLAASAIEASQSVPTLP